MARAWYECGFLNPPECAVFVLGNAGVRCALNERLKFDGATYVRCFGLMRR